MTPKEAYDKGFRDALESFAWWKDGVQYVGSGVFTLEAATEARRNNGAYRPPLDPRNDPADAKECWRRLVEFCQPSPEDVEAMTDEEVHQYLVDEGIDIEPGLQRLRAKLAEIRAHMESEESK